jgi:hypothetical protein
MVSDSVNIALRLSGAATLCAALLLTACAKKSSEGTQSTTTTTQGAQASPAAAGAAATGEATTSTPAAAATRTDSSTTVTTGGGTTTVTTKSGNGAVTGFIDMPVYPGAKESKDQAMSMSANGGSVTIKVYTTSDDAKKVADWYKSQLPSSWKGGVLTSGDKTIGTFSNETGDGDQSVIVANQDDKTTRIQLATKHGK